MNHPRLGVKQEDRWYHLRRYPKCFVGTEAVAWMLDNLPELRSRADAVRLGNELMEASLIYHVADSHEFADGHFFYEFRPGMMNAKKKKKKKKNHFPQKNFRENNQKDFRVLICSPPLLYLFSPPLSPLSPMSRHVYFFFASICPMSQV